MKYKILSLFPEMFANFKTSSIIGRAIDSKKIDIDIVNFRDYTNFKNNKVDDTIYGGGSGMLIAAEPIDLAVESIKETLPKNSKTKYIYMSPRGKKLTQKVAKEIVQNADNLIILCGHYEGVDERILKLHNFEEISIGDYILTGGELASMILIDTTARLVESVITKESLDSESFENSLLEYPQYTKPVEYKSLKVPEVLLSGHHQKIEDYRRKQSIYITYKNRPDLLNEAILNGTVKQNELEEIIKEGGNS
ncbi:MAG: tRNA (guanosine(37)-N1)-methyltransferase TrmD [Clostridia bacterium]